LLALKFLFSITINGRLLESTMDDLNFTIPPAKPSYDTKVALKYFKASGSTMSAAAGQTIFIENEKSNPLFLQRDKMYFLVEGEVDLTVNKTNVCVIRSGDLFGEMGLITRMPRPTPCCWPDLG
jgi:hypothetical protein